nr:integrase, catalytic region, zinc finger, CCHC-type, peptidase aspartic, catalytic [Tanacetum cinerariifolium]
MATACYPQNRSIIHQRFNKTPYELIQGRKLDISYLHVFGALCYSKNDREDIGKLGAKGDIGFFIGYSANSVAYRVYNRRTKKIMDTMNVTFDELSAMAFEKNNSGPGLQSLTSGQIKAPRTIPAAPIIQNLQAPSASMSIQDFAPTPTNFSNTLISSHNIDEQSQQHVQQQRNLTSSPTAFVADNVPNAVFEGDLFAEAMATACYPQNRSIIHQCFNKTPYELIQGRKPDISYLYVFGALCYSKNDREDIGKLGAKEAPRTIHAAPIIQNLQAPSASMSIQDFAPTPTISSNTLISSHSIDKQSQQPVQQQRNLTLLPTAFAADNVSNAVFEGDLFVNPFATPSDESVVSSTQYVDP